VGSKDGYILSGKEMITCTGHIRITEFGNRVAWKQIPNELHSIADALYRTVGMRGNDPLLCPGVIEDVIFTTDLPCWTYINFQWGSRKCGGESGRYFATVNSASIVTAKQDSRGPALLTKIMTGSFISHPIIFSTSIVDS
jgi:hypothetical protein